MPEVNELLAELDKKTGEAITNTKAATTTATEALDKVKALETSFKEMASKDNEVAKKAAEEAEEALKQVKDFLASQGRKGKASETVKTLGSMIFDMIGESQKAIDDINMGKTKSIKLEFDKKAVADMTLGNNLTGAGVITYRNNIIERPMWPVHLRDLIAVTPSATDSYHFYRQLPGEGNIDWQSAEGANKSQIDEDYVEVTVVLRYLAGFLVITRQMLRNLPALQANLSRWLPEQYYRAEDAKGYATLSGTAGLTAGDTTGANTINRILITQGTLESLGYIVTGIVMNPIDWAKLMTNASAGTTTGIYSLPGSVVLAPDGSLQIAGMTIRKANWIPSGTIVMGDWRYFEIIQSEALSMRLFEEDGTNVRQNKVTVRIEASIGFAVLDPAAFSLVTVV